MNLFKRFVAFAIAVVMICGALPVSAMAVETHDHSDHSDIQPFTSTEDLIEQVKAMLAEQGKTYAEEAEDQDLVEAVENESGYSFDQAKTQLGLGFFNNRTGSEGSISTAHLNLDETTMTALVESTLKAYYLDGIVEAELVVEDGIVTAVNFTMRDSFAAGLDEIENGVSTETDEAEETEAAHETAVASYSVEATAEEAEEKPFPFTDVPKWAKTAVNYLYQRGIVSGVSATKYGSNMNVTRGQAVMMIWRAVESPDPKGKNTFTDVKSGAYYEDAVVWAAENGIVSGTGNNKFSPNDNITREQLIAIMYKLAQFRGMDVSNKASLSAFKDAGKIAKYAQEAVKWAVAAGLTSGYEDGTFRPKGTATRAEYAQVLYKFLLIPTHEMVHVEATASTCSVQGNIEHWYCSKCGKLFADENGKTELTEKDVLLPLDPTVHNPVPVAEVSPTCTATGVAAHYKCACGLVVDSRGNVVTDMKDLILPATGHSPAADDETTVWNWERVVSYYFNTDANGNPTFDQGLTDGNGNPVPDFPVDEDGNIVCSLYFDAETGEISVGYQEIVTWECSSVEFTCQGCGEKFEVETTVDSYVMTEEWLEETVNAYAQEVATELITEYVTNKAMAYYGETGKAPTEEMQNQWVAEAQQDPELMGKVEQAANAKAMELAQDLESTIYVATSADEIVVDEKTGAVEAIVVQTNELNATRDQLQRDWANMCAFNEYYSNYFGLVAPYWASKNTETSPLGAVIYMCSQEEQDLIPNAYLDMMVSMLTQAFMSYVYSYADLLDGMIADAMAVVNYTELDTIDKLLLLHDWLAKYGTFDMQSLVDITMGTSSGNDPIAMTAFGVLLNDQIDKGEDATWDGGVCLGYAATYALLIQQAFGMEQDDEAMVDFAKIQFLTNVAESSVASGDSGFGDGDSMFNSAHYLNAVKLGDEWYYIDACYDDINTEVISQQRVETHGNVSHTSFLLAPATWEEMYEDSFQYMDSLYDGKVWQRVYDGESGYYKMDGDRNIYTAAEAAAMEEEAEANGENIQLFYYYEVSETSSETRYEDTTYEEAWFVSANSAVNYDPDTQYFYYTSGAITSYSTMKDMFGDDEDSNSSMGDSMSQEDMLEYKYDSAAQDKIVRRPVDATNEPSDSGNSFSMSQASDEYCEVLFHFGYGTTGAEAHAQFEADNEDNSMTGGSDSGDAEEPEKGPWYDLCEEDAVYLSNYPDLVHSTVMIDGKLYFNIANCIYTFNYTVSELAQNAIESITTLELVKVKEYNEVSYTSNGKRFTGMSFEVSNSGETLTYHPVAALSVHDVITWSDSDNDGYAETRTAEPTLFVSIGTNLSNSYKDDNDEAYTIEARNFNPDYYRFMEEDEESSEETNTNTEFMWCANVVEKMPVEDMLNDLESGRTTTVSVDAYCAHNAFTETRTTTYGLSVADDKTEEEGTALKHEYVADETEGTNICAVCLEDHEHDYSYATSEDIVITWSYSENEDGTAVVDAEAYIPCGNDEYCNLDETVDCTVTGPDENAVYTATATYGTVTKTEEKTLNQLKHTEHTYGEPEFTWTEVTAEDGTVTGYTATATFTCTEVGNTCEIAEDQVVGPLDCEVSKNSDGDYIATVTGPDGNEYTSDPLHSYGEVSWSWTQTDGAYTAATASKTCSFCGDVISAEAEITVTVTSEDTCTEAKVTVYDATATLDGETVTDKQTVTVDEITEHEYDENGVCIYGCGATDETHVHAYGDPSYTWTSDYSSCTESKTCSTCKDELTETVASAYAVTTAATCETTGVGAYTVSFSDGTTDSRSVTIEATGHNYVAEAEGEEEWVYNEETDSMTCSIVYTCSNCQKTDSEGVQAVKQEDGSWIATFTKYGTITRAKTAE